MKTEVFLGTGLPTNDETIMHEFNKIQLLNIMIYTEIISFIFTLNDTLNDLTKI